MSASVRIVSDQPIRIRSVAFVLVGVAALVLKRHYPGPFEDIVLAYGGNVAASFAVYFVIAPLFLAARFTKLLTTGLALIVVELFEATDGFGVMSNVYDRIDFAANVVGVGLALLVDILARAITRARSALGEPPDATRT